ncbi:MAG: B12-binding domain-containing radical SAM protein [Candidatus Anammoxibacter sp.]
MKSSSSKNKFVFVNLAVDSGIYTVNHGIAYLVPIIKENLFGVSLLNITNDISCDEFRDQIKLLNPSIVGFSFTSLHTKHLIKYSKAIEGLPNVLQIAGGVGATLDHERIMPKAAIDGFVVGEGEIPIGNLLKSINNGIDIYNTDGFYWKRDGHAAKRGASTFVNDLNELSLPDYSVFDRDLVVYGTPLNINIMLSRGCPYKCTYCSNSALRSVYPESNGYFRLNSVDHSIKLVEKLVNEYPEAAFVTFEDDLLIAKKDWFISFANEYHKRIGLPYRVNIRTECINDDIVKVLKESGCVIGHLGLESGNEDLRKKLLNRRHTNESLIEKTGMVKKAGIKLFTFNVVGLPFETKENMLETLDLNKKVKADSGQCTFYYPFPGTELYETCKSKGLLKGIEGKDVPTNFFVTPIIPQTNKEKEDCIAVHKKINNFLKWQELKYKICSAEYVGAKKALYITRLIVIYLLNRFTSPYEKNSLFRRIADNKLQKRLKDMLKDKPALQIK